MSLKIKRNINSVSTCDSKPVVGIDLGTTHSLVAVYLNQKTRIISNNGEKLIASIINIDSDNKINIGDNSSQDKYSFKSIKRVIGKSSTEAKKILADQYELLDNENIATFLVNKNPVNAVELSSKILAKLRDLVIQENIGYAQNDLIKAVITVPAYFDDAMRKATIDAAKLAKIEVVRLINEPTAAAMAYGLDFNAKGKCLIFDLGGGTFDVSLLELKSGVFRVLATAGDVMLGGDDFDYLLAKYLFGQEKLSAQQLAQAKAIKEQLSDSKVVSNITQEQFNQICEPVLAKIWPICQQVLDDAKLKFDDIEHLVCVGGATRMPIIRQQLAEFFNKEPLTAIDPDTVVAMGAAKQAALLSKHTDQKLTGGPLLLDVIPLSIGLEMLGGVNEKILLRNTPLPCVKTEVFTNHKDNQTGLILHVLQGERELAKDCRSLAKFELDNLPPMAKGCAKIEVKFQIDVDGLLTVSAKELTHGISSSINVMPSYGLTHDQISSMINSAIDNAEDDLINKKTAKLANELSDLGIMMDKLVIKYPDLVTDSLQQVLHQGHRLLESYSENSNLITIQEFEDQIDKLKHLSENLIELSVKENIALALSSN